MSLLQTLDRGVQALNIIARHPEGMSIAELAESLGVHRAIAYRIIATLEANALVSKRAEGKLFLGGGVLVLASYLEPQLRAGAHPLLRSLARETGATAFLSCAEGAECVALLVVEPEEGVLRVGYRVGSRHPLSRGAAGIAILSARPEQADDTDEVKQARRDGYSITRGQLQRGAVGVASPVCGLARKQTYLESSVGVVGLDFDAPQAVASVKDCATRIGALLA